MSTNSNPYRDREQGQMGFGQNDNANPKWEQDAPARPNEDVEGWKSNSFSLPLHNGEGLGSVDPSDSNESDSGPAWPSQSKDRK
jgi:hypothetical protein